MNEDQQYKVSDYSLFDSASGTVSNLINEFNSCNSELNESKNLLSSESVFLGPICDSCLEEFKNAGLYLQDDIDNCDKIINHFKSSSANYQTGDKETTKLLLNSTNSSGTANSTAQGAVDWAIGIANDNNYGYVSGGMGNGGYDCTQFVHAAYEAAGVSLPEKGNVNNANIVDYYTTRGFEWHPGKIDPNELQPGDVLVNQAHHAEIYIGNGQKVGAHSNYDNSSGDSGGNEISVDGYKEFGNGGWDGYLRYTA